MPKVNIDKYIDNKGRYKQELSNDPDIRNNKNYEKFNKTKVKSKLK